MFLPEPGQVIAGEFSHSSDSKLMPRCYISYVSYVSHDLVKLL